jgi:hypothetical protein
MSLKEIAKAQRERQIFEEFVKAADLEVEISSIRSERPPLPDVSCLIVGERYYFELAEIADNDLARNLALTEKDLKTRGGAFSYSDPLQRVFQIKVAKNYAAPTGKLELLAYFDKQYPPTFDDSYIPREVGSLAKSMITSGVWRRIWFYDNWNKRILWVHPEDEPDN